jgi:hypothetical protein
MPVSVGGVEAGSSVVGAVMLTPWAKTVVGRALAD